MMAEPEFKKIKPGQTLRLKSNEQVSPICCLIRQALLIKVQKYF
jgi:hypothetical protein